MVALVNERQVWRLYESLAGFHRPKHSQMAAHVFVRVLSGREIAVGYSGLIERAACLPYEKVSVRQERDIAAGRHGGVSHKSGRGCFSRPGRHAQHNPRLSALGL